MFAQKSSPERTRTSDKAVNSRLLYQLSYRGMVRKVSLRGGNLTWLSIRIKCIWSPRATVSLPETLFFRHEAQNRVRYILPEL